MLVQDILIQEHSAAPDQSCSSLKVVSKYFETWRKAGSFCTISSKPYLLQRVTDYMVSHGMVGSACRPETFSGAYSQFVDLNPAFVVLSLDDFGGIGKVYNKIRYFRDERPDVPFILASSDFKAHDLSDERLPVCDISLKMPFDSTTSLEHCFMAVWDNNERWVNRKSFLRV